MFKRFFTFAIFCFPVTELNPFWNRFLDVLYERVKGLEHPAISTTIKHLEHAHYFSQYCIIFIYVLFLCCPICVLQVLYVSSPFSFKKKNFMLHSSVLSLFPARQYHHLHFIFSSIFSLNPTLSFSTKHRILENSKNIVLLNRLKTRQESQIIVLMNQTVSI